MESKGVFLSHFYMMEAMKLFTYGKPLTISQPKMYVISNSLNNTLLGRPLTILEKNISEKIIRGEEVDDEYIIRMISCGIIFPYPNAYFDNYMHYLQRSGRNIQHTLSIF